ncbi:response regulator transcription factor [Frankia sp. AgB1.9]|uniref:response regulator transcription factor n=1 Tax=unclassified Frankia TaxID=2632575 RepID=UPI00193458C7|nr:MULTISPECIES: response regulator transcription factor [unclassified Frankia]MBL7491595.1 response regulator transcription factor [Frankia sp. AgW1.1]MBL7554043.1 response regulator transcription factor [Frankia sp. AgB1.9]MBL7618225.1 response regulator transcription factor [Frankia sp. AgB1.8]
MSIPTLDAQVDQWTGHGVSPEGRRWAPGSDAPPAAADGEEASAKLLIADTDVSEETVRALRRAGVEVTIVHDGASALLETGFRRPDALLVAATLPVLDGIAVVRAVRARLDRSVCPILLALGADESDRAGAGLDAGANGCLARPYGVPELLGVVREVRNPVRLATPPGVLCVRHITMDVANYDVLVREKPVHFPLLEFRVLRILMENAGNVVTLETICELGWGSPNTASNTVSVHMRRIRKRLGDTGSPRLIESVRGVGYRLRLDGERSRNRS